MADHGVMGRSAGPGARAMRSWCSQCAGIAAPRARRALVGLRRSMRSERDTRRRGRDASETGAVDKRVRSARARRSEPAIRRDRREASEPCRSAPARWHRHGAMRSGSAGDATASPRPPASRADAAVETPAEPRRSMRSERDTRRRGRDASEAMRRSDRSIPAPARRSRQWQCDGIALPRASRTDPPSGIDRVNFDQACGVGPRDDLIVVRHVGVVATANLADRRACSVRPESVVVVRDGVGHVILLLLTRTVRHAVFRAVDAVDREAVASAAKAGIPVNARERGNRFCAGGPLSGAIADGQRKIWGIAKSRRPVIPACHSVVRRAKDSPFGVAPGFSKGRIGRGVARWSSHSAMTAKRARRCDGATDRSRHRRGVAGSGNATALPCRERAVSIRQRGAIDRKVSPTRRDGARCPGAPPRAT